MMVSAFGIERLECEGFDEFVAAVLVLNGIEDAYFYVAAMLAEGPMCEITCDYREFLEFAETNDAIIAPHLIRTTSASAAN
jgi:hypothetical protein